MVRRISGSKFMNESMGEKIFDIVRVVLIIFVLITVAYPLYFCCIASISSPNAVYQGRVILWPADITLKGYEELMANADIWRGYVNSILYTTVGTLCNMVFTIPMAFALSRKEFPASGIIMKLIVFTMYFSGGMIPLYFVVNNLKLLNTIWALVLPVLVVAYNLIVARSFFSGSIPEELKEATFLDGGNYFYFFFKVVLPLSKSLLAVMVLFYASMHWNDYFQALLYMQDGDKAPLQLVLRQILVQSQSQAADTSDLTAMVEKQEVAELLKYGAIIVSSVPMLLVYPFVQKHFVKGVMIGAVKG
ncbi:MAG: carbohydrate ABC transporter permease [Eubacteriales bacterium]